MKGYIGINNKAQKISKIYIGDENGKARGISKIYVGNENGKARNIYSGACNLVVKAAINQSFRITINGTAITEYGKTAYEGTFPSGTSYLIEYKADDGDKQYTYVAQDSISGILTSNLIIPESEAIVEVKKYRVTIEQSPNQTITVQTNRSAYAFSFYAYYGDTYTITAQAAEGYEAGKLSTTEGTITDDLTITITQALIRLPDLVPMKPIQGRIIMQANYEMTILCTKCFNLECSADNVNWIRVPTCASVTPQNITSLKPVIRSKVIYLRGQNQGAMGATAGSHVYSGMFDVSVDSGYEPAGYDEWCNSVGSNTSGCCNLQRYVIGTWDALEDYTTAQTAHTCIQSSRPWDSAAYMGTHIHGDWCVGTYSRKANYNLSPCKYRSMDSKTYASFIEMLEQKRQQSS